MYDFGVYTVKCRETFSLFVFFHILHSFGVFPFISGETPIIYTFFFISYMGFCDCVLLASESDQIAWFFFFFLVLLGRNCLGFSINKGVA